MCEPSRRKPNRKQWQASEPAIDKICQPLYNTLMNDNFWSKVVETDSCWLWLGSKRDGYGMFWSNGKLVSAHRMAWEIVHGRIPDGLLVLHKCDIRECVNPEHLFLGTHLDNFLDCIMKGRPGYIAPHPKLNKELVAEIKQSLACGALPIMLSKHYNISIGHVLRIKNGKRWKTPATEKDTLQKRLE